MPLFIGPDEQAALNAAVERARAKPLTIQQVMQGAKGMDQSTDVLTLADRKGKPEPRHPQQVELPVGYRVSISIEEQPAGICLHLSMSSSARGKVPHPDAVRMVLEAVGIGLDRARRVWLEEFLIDGKPGGYAVNVVVVLNPAQGGHA
jgi:hypothetical protein